MPDSKKKKQHYVPRFLLRNFSGDKRRIQGLRLCDGLIFDEASISTQCYGDYFYGKDGQIEDSFSKEEEAVSKILYDMSPTALEGLSNEDLMKVVFFMHYQRYRTAAAADYVDNVSGGYLKKIARVNLPLLAGDITVHEEGLDKVRLKTHRPQITALQQAVTFMPLLFDLEIKFIIRQDPPGFIISDNPVALYNQFIEHHRHLKHYDGITGLAVMGVQLFLPISPTVCIALYDPITYRYGAPRRRSCHASKLDALLINRLIAIYARECIYYNNTCTGKYIDSIMTVRADHDIHNPRIITDPLTGNVENWIPSVRLGAKFSFAQVIEKRSFKGYYDKGPPIRSSGMLSLVKNRWKKVAEAAGASKTPPPAASDPPAP